MKFYVEYKHCHLSLENENKILLGRIENLFMPSIVEFDTDNKDNINSRVGMYITDDRKYLYYFYKGHKSFLRIINISAKPIKRKINKIEQYKSLQKEIDELKQKQRRLFYRQD